MPFIKELVVHGFKSFARDTRIPFRNTMNTIVGPNGSGKSARWDTRILLASGETKLIGEIVEESIKQAKTTDKLDDGILTYENPLNISVLSLDPQSMVIKESNVNAFIKREGEPNLFTIKTRIGKEVTTTSCHPILIYKNGEIISEVVGNLKEGDFIATPRILNLVEKKEDPRIGTGKDIGPLNLARFLGYIVGDGCIIPNSRIDFVNADKEILDDYRAIIKKFGFSIGEGDRVGSIAKNIYLYSRALSNALITFFKGDYKKEGKHIPEEILFSRKEVLSNFLGALFDCDASVRRDNPTFEYCTMSKRLADEVMIGLLRFGIVARKIKKLKYATNTEAKIKREYFYILVEGKEKITGLYEQINLKCEHKRILLEKWAKRDIVPNTNNDLLPKEVNLQIKELVELLGIKTKKIRKIYPLLSAYIENRCSPSREGIRRLLSLFKSKLDNLISFYNKIKLNQTDLIKFMDSLAISSRVASESIGLYKTTIRNNWGKQLFEPRTENLIKFKVYLEKMYLARLMRINRLIKLLTTLSNSEIFWDKISKIEKVKGEEYVYDLEIEGTHNFIGNEIFVHNSNITDAICFVLGRMGGKSMRAKKLSNLIFAGTQQYKPASEASVEMIFDNTDKGFSLNESEVSIKRILRKNGAGVYKINGDIKTRQEVLELLSQAGIDPNGFNIVLQGEIDSFVKMSPDERREVIEEVAGISIYEMRKKHSLQELEKTESRLKETNAILRERNSYLKNLEEEKKQALHFKKLQEDVRSYKASISYKLINEKQDKLDEINEAISKEQEAIAKINSLLDKTNQEIAILNEKISHITLNIQKASGLEQERLNSEISDLRADMAGLLIKKQNHESSLNDMSKRKEELGLIIQNAERDILESSKTKGKSVKHELDIKKKQLEEIEEQKRKLYQLKSTVSSLNSRIEEKQRQVHRIRVEYEFNYNKIRQGESEIIIKDNLELHKEKIVVLRTELEKLRKEIDSINKIKIGNEKQIAILERSNEDHIKIQAQVSSLDVCPLCKTKITKEHVNHVIEDAEKEKSKNTEGIERLSNEIKEFGEKTIKFIDGMRKIEDELKVRSQDVLRLELIDEKKEIIRRYSEDLKLQEKENAELIKKKDSLENQISSIKTSESNSDSLRLEIQELERHEEKNLGMELTLKQRDIERDKNLLKQIGREIEESLHNLKEINTQIEEKQAIIDDKNDQDRMLKEKFRKTLEDKAKHQEKIHMFERDILHKQNEKHLSEEKINNLKIERAQFIAQKEAIEHESQEFRGAKIIKMSLDELRKKVEETQLVIMKIGTVNMKALEVYEDVRKEYEKIQEKVNIILQEKEEILKVIGDIDKKKKKAFMETLEKINELFSRNFSQLSDKGIATLEPADKEKLFDAGVDMLIKVGKGKYFDTNSLSGGEKSLISLSLIFAIQEYKPYCFYIFDEIDAALDRRNSERLATLLKRYINRGQYIIITHNDSLITESPVIYGVSMQDKISKVLTLEV